MTCARAVTVFLFAASLVACGGGGGPSTPSPNSPPSSQPPPSAPPPATDKWTSAAPVPTALSEAGGAVWDGKLYVVGGATGIAAGELLMSSTLHIYDPASDGWSTGAPLPQPTHHIAVVAHGGLLYAVGGFSAASLPQQTGIGAPRDELWIYDIAADSWSAGPPMPTARGALGAAVIDGRIHAAGGMGVSNILDPLPFRTLEIFDIATGLWSTGTDMPGGREQVGVAALGGKLYVAGGRVSRTSVDALTVYDPATQQWSELAPLPSTRGGGALVAFQGELYHLGGERLSEGGAGSGGPDLAVPIPGTSPEAFEEVEIYNAGQDAWRSGDPMPTPRHGLVAGVIGNAIFAVGGGDLSGWSFLTRNERWEP